jgi:hypothetical protein
MTALVRRVAIPPLISARIPPTAPIVNWVFQHFHVAYLAICHAVMFPSLSRYRRMRFLDLGEGEFGIDLFRSGESPSIGGPERKVRRNPRTPGAG